MVEKPIDINDGHTDKGTAQALNGACVTHPAYYFDTINFITVNGGGDKNYRPRTFAVDDMNGHR